MPRVDRRLLSRGIALLPVLVGVSDTRAESLSQRGVRSFPLRLNLQIDTGASVTCLDRATVAALGLVPANFEGTSVRTPFSGTEPLRVRIYDVSLRLPSDEGSFHIASVSVVLGDFRGEAETIHGVLGCDVLASCLFSYDGRRGYYSLDFPAAHIPRLPRRR